MGMTSFPCPSCGSKGAFEITSEAEDLSAIVGARCLKCGHVVTQKQFDNWALKVATELAKERFKKSGTGIK